MKTKTLLAAAIAMTFGYAASANANIIDLFQDPANGVDGEYPQQVILFGSTVNVGSTAFNQNSTAYPSTILGGYRDISLTATSDFTAAGDFALLTAADGKLNFSNTGNVNTVAAVQWDGNDNNIALDVDGLGGANLINQVGCGSGCAAFITTVEFADFDFPYEITVYDMAGNSSTLIASSQFSVGTPPQQQIPGPVSADYLFDWFNFASGSYTEAGLNFEIVRPGGEVDFTNVGALELKINVGANSLTAVDLIIGPVLKVPEPGILGLMGLGGLMAGFASRRRKALKA